MVESEYRFTGLLANVDKSILNLELDHGFEIKALKKDKAIELVSRLENRSPGEALFRLSQFGLIKVEKHIYLINRSVMIDETDQEDIYDKYLHFEKDLFTGYIKPTIMVLRLFKEGNIYIPIHYYYNQTGGKIQKMIQSPANVPILGRLVYNVKKSEELDLKNFLSNLKLPLREPFLRLSHENFDNSYHLQNINLSFLMLMNGLEALYHPGGADASHRISRNCAVLLGNDKKRSLEIFAELKEFFNKRSQLVHTGKSGIINSNNLLRLRLIVRESIKKIYFMGIGKEKLLEHLNLSGFDKER